MENIHLNIYDDFYKVNSIDKCWYDRYDVKRGLRNSNGTGVIAGVTNVSNVHGYVMSDGDKLPDEGRLTFRGYDINDLLLNNAPEDGRFRFEEIAYLLMCGKLPNKAEFEVWKAAIESYRSLPDGFTEIVLMQKTSQMIMNMINRAWLMLYYADPDAENRSPEHEVDTALQFMARIPRIMVNSHYAIERTFNNGSLILHHPLPGLSTAETILSCLRPDRQYTQAEAEMLDIMLCLHAEHGGGNNSTFAARVLTSADTDAYSCYAGALGSLKGAKHGGANFKVRGMQDELKANVADWENEDEVAAYLGKIVRKEAFDHSGLVYGMGHAVYTKSDPRAIIAKKFATELAKGTEYEAELNLLKLIEKLSPEVMKRERGITKDVCANIDMYTGFIYKMMGIPEDMFTPLFACGRIAGWAAHRFEEIGSGKRIIRPAYKTTVSNREYKPMSERD